MKLDLLLRENNSSEIIDRYFLFNENEPVEYLPNTKKINIFVGANNSGKSWMMRYLMTMVDFKYLEYNEVLNYSTEFDKLLEKDLITEQLKNIRLLNVNLPKIQLKRIESKNFTNLLNKIQQNIQNFGTLNGIESRYLQYYDNLIEKNISDQLNILTDKMVEKIDEAISFVNIKKYYIPTLRTAHSLYNFKEEKYIKIEEDIFKNTLRKNYKVNNDIDIFTGVHLYKEILNSRNSKKEIRKRFEDFESFVQKNFFSGKKIDIVAEFDKDKSLINDNSEENISIHVDGENETRKLHELGDGIQAIIILMYKIFMAEDDSVIFIDEPEINLHPGMQRLFFEQISLNKDITKKNLTYFISTHSNHLLDITLENDNVSIYSFNQIIENGTTKIVVKNVNSGNNELLRDLGVNNSSVFLANCSIWVEGISDRNYIKSFLWAYCNEFKNLYPREDIDFVFFEYAGGNIEHFLFNDEMNDNEEERFLEEINTLTLSNRIFLVADSDMAEDKSKKHTRLKLLENKFKKNENLDGQIFWNIREAENLLSKDVWNKILINLCNKNLTDENTQSDIDQYFLKLNEIIPHEYVGKFLKKIKESGIPLNEVCKKQKRGKGEEWQTYSDKANLSRIILEKTLNKELVWADFKSIPEVVELTENLFNFISKRR